MLGINTETRFAQRAVGIALAALAAPAIVCSGVPTAGALPGQVDANPGREDYDGTQGSIDRDGTVGDIVEAVHGIQYTHTTESTGQHTVVSDACHVKGSTYCLPANGYGPERISAVSGVKENPVSSLDGDGFQTNGK